jgi:hypothetical protein
MANPFKPDDKVQTKVKGTVVDATVRLVWNEVVQVHTADNALAWRSAKTVWFPAATSLPVDTPPANTASSGETGDVPHLAASVATPPASEVAPEVEAPAAPTPSEPVSTDAIESAPVTASPASMDPSTPQLTACGTEVPTVAKRKDRKRKR